MYAVALFQYGLVFGIPNLAGLLSAPFVGTLGSKHVGVKRLFIVGSFLQFACGILFGLGTLINNHTIFLLFSYVLRYEYAQIIVLLF